VVLWAFEGPGPQYSVWVPTPDGQSHGLVMATADRTALIVESLTTLDEEALLASSALPNWSRLTIACHLRYGAEALCRMTKAALAGRPTAFYPEGRERQRPRTLVPRPGESNLAVVASLARQGEELTQLWATCEKDVWHRDVIEPSDNPDLGPVALGRLPLLRLTEVEVHGSDLGLGLPDWSELFVAAALPMRLQWLNTRRANHRQVDASLEGSWLLVATDGPAHLVTVTGTKVAALPADAHVPCRARIQATRRDLLALLLGRPLSTTPLITGDPAFGAAFADAFPGP
jgi:hypothetical protein